MSIDASNPVKTCSQSFTLAAVPEENLVRIFGFLDLKALAVVSCVCELFARIQEDDDLWKRFIPEGYSLRPELSVKENFRCLETRLKMQDHDGFEHECILNFDNRTITQIGDSLSFFTSRLAFDHASIPNGSFVVYANGDGSWYKTYEAIIKVKSGVLCYSNLLNRSMFGELREPEGEPSQFREFKIICKGEQQLDSSYIAHFINLLKGINQ